MIEGIVYFDLETDKQLRVAVKREKSELITMMMKEKNKGMKTQPIKKKEKEYLHCNSL